MRKPKVLFISRKTLYSSPGGDTVQIDCTATQLRLLGVQVDVSVTGERVDQDQYDLLHFFNIIRPADILAHTAKSAKPFVVSTIYVDYGEYERRVRSGLLGALNSIVKSDTTEYLKAIARWVVNGERVGSISYLLMGHKRSVQSIIRQSSMLLPNSLSEARRLYAAYGVRKRYVAVPNGIDTARFQLNGPKSSVYRDAVLCVGRIEGRKNQLNLIRALNGTSLKLFLIGRSAPNGGRYFESCRREAGPNVTFVEHMDQQALVPAYRAAKVHALPSWFETTGLSSLEAGYMGCNVVITSKGDTREYFGTMAFYCNPDDPGSIRDAVLRAHASPTSGELRSRIEAKYTWQRAAEATLRAYYSVLNWPLIG